MKQFGYRVLIFASLVFLVVALWRLDYLQIPYVVSWTRLTLAVLLCGVGTVAGSVTWRSAVQQVGVRVTHSVCIAAVGLSIFGKYVPGKLWANIGRAGYTARMTHTSFSELFGTSLSLQIVTVWSGLGIGLLGLAFTGGTQPLFFLSIGAWLVLGAVLVFSPSEPFLLRIASRLGVSLPQLKLLRISHIIRVLPWQLLTWGAWALGFYLLVESLQSDPMPWSVALAFPLAASLGIVAIFFPGGLGVREGVLAGCLTLHGMGLCEAAGVAVAARLWFIVGEVFIFGCGLVAHYVSNTNQSKNGVTRCKE